MEGEGEGGGRGRGKDGKTHLALAFYSYQIWTQKSSSAHIGISLWGGSACLVETHCFGPPVAREPV